MTHPYLHFVPLPHPFCISGFGSLLTAASASEVGLVNSSRMVSGFWRGAASA
ncbi:hypothetical protein [Vibrio aestuarianus]|uniref:Uncharacterized protein n=1 Tax=Vibrio aestuarianus TaxID=28171 RepID=A0A9X4F2I8_9VIBR|nr:hypothetical protein [Vibrio aestuarianus]MDE1243169.1 hypothetical protein [Vibrio aestuarianus]